MGERIESEGHYEMLYDCEHCGTKRLLAKSQRHCAECGAPQNPDKRYFPAEGEAQRVDGHQYEGADRHCPSCNTPQGAKGKNCTQCGAALDGAREVKGVVAAPPPPKKRRRQWIVLAVVAGIALLVFGIWFAFFRTKAAELVISSHRWERAIGVEEYGEKHDDAWRDQLPEDARDVTCQQKKRSTRKVETGEEDCHTERHDKKDGTYEQIKKCTPIYREEAVEDDWCRYTVRQWRALDPIKITGGGRSPAWPTEGLPPPQSPPVLGMRRQGKRTETFMLDIAGQSCEVPAATWNKYSDGQKVKVEVRASSGKIVCDSL
ncbi:MAG: uncharacterized protein JWP01_2172 [Myxococcales bacterium]|nr:uncharacterized protein [Myxococcales bacterium]